MFGYLTIAAVTRAMADDSLEVNHMNVKPKGNHIMHDTAYNGQIQKMYTTIFEEKRWLKE